MIFKDVRVPALTKWLAETKRVRQNETDNIDQAFECSWQTRFGTKPDTDLTHYSVFCSIGEWNTAMTDFLTDERWDMLNLTIEHDKDVLFRHYTRILLCASEILTDFQDLLSIFNAGQFLTGLSYAVRKATNTASRIALNANLPADRIQNMFTYINNICKHKINNIHVCNHHLNLHFEESGVCPSPHGITIDDIGSFISDDPAVAPAKQPDCIVIPNLNLILEAIINAYKVVDATFRADMAKYAILCNLYQGVSIR